MCRYQITSSLFQNWKYMPEIRAWTAPEIHKPRCPKCLESECVVMHLAYKIVNTCGVQTFLKLFTYGVLQVRALSKVQKPQDSVGGSCSVCFQLSARASVPWGLPVSLNGKPSGKDARGGKLPTGGARYQQQT